jgi:Helix-turn-helix
MDMIEQQFSKAIDILVQKGVISSKTEVAKSLYLTKQVLSDITNGRNKLKNSTLSLFCKTYQISLQWLFYDEGEMFVEGARLPKAEDLEEVTLNRKDLEQLVEQKVKQVLQQYHSQGLSAIQA